MKPVARVVFLLGIVLALVNVGLLRVNSQLKSRNEALHKLLEPQVGMAPPASWGGSFRKPLRSRF